jgi:DnaJ-class molecular chaperone
MKNAELEAKFNNGEITQEEYAEKFDYAELFSQENIDKWEEEDRAEKIEKEIEAARYKKCGRCNGKGRIGHYHYVSNGVCFACDGAGKVYK